MYKESKRAVNFSLSEVQTTAKISSCLWQGSSLDLNNWIMCGRFSLKLELWIIPYALRWMSQPQFWKQIVRWRICWPIQAMENQTGLHEPFWQTNSSKWQQYGSDCSKFYSSMVPPWSRGQGNITQICCGQLSTINCMLHTFCWFEEILQTCHHQWVAPEYLWHW